MELIQEIGSYAGFAAVFGLAVLSALYFSQARDVKRLREWAGRAPERAAEIEAGGRAAAAVPVAARPQPQVRPAGEAEGDAAEAGAEAAAPGTAAPAPAAAAAGGAAAASVSATPAAASDATDEDEEPGTAVRPAPGAPARPAPATAGAAAQNGTEEGVTDEDAGTAEEEEVGAAPAAATPAGAVASGAGTAERPAAPAPGDTGTGVKVLPPRRPVPPVRPRPTIPPRTIPPRSGAPGSVLGQAPGSRPPQRGRRNWPAPRYIALIVGAIVILGLGGTVGVLQLTKEDEPVQQEAPEARPDTNVAPDQPDQPEPARVNPAEVTVAVLNATSTTGLAARVGSQLEGDGFQTGNLTNAAERQRAESVVMFKPGRNAEARAVARRLDIGSIEPIDAASQSLAGDAMVVVVLGADKAQE